jgi:hypothetical protein
MRQLDKKFIETIMYLTGDDEKAASKTTSESFFGMLNRFIEIFIKAIPVPPTSDAGKDKKRAKIWSWSESHQKPSHGWYQDWCNVEKDRRSTKIETKQQWLGQFLVGHHE